MWSGKERYMTQKEIEKCYNVSKVASQNEGSPMNDERIGDAIGAIILGVVGGILLAALARYLSRRYRCPVCGTEIQYGVNPCPHCRTILNWV